MNFFRLWMAMAAALSGSASAEETSVQSSVKYDCGDVVVTGRVNNVDDSYEEVDTGNVYLGAGRISAEVKIHRLLKEQETRRSVRANYIAHNYLPENRDFLMVLIPKDDGSYFILEYKLAGRSE